MTEEYPVIDAGLVRGFVTQMRIVPKITDLDDLDWKYVDWDHLAEHWTEARKEELEYQEQWK